MEDLSFSKNNDIRRRYGPEISEDDLALAYEEVRAKYRKAGVYLPDNKMKIDADKIALEWKTGHYRDIPPDVAYKEIERIKQKHGHLTAEILLDESRPTKAVFHSCFNWDDAAAADLFRIQQARKLIQNITISILSNGETKQVRVYEVVRKEDNKGIYKNINTLTSDDVEYIRVQVLKALTSYRNKLAVYDRFKVSVKHLDNAISELEVLEEKKQQVAA